jgi:hypothetical protein
MTIFIDCIRTKFSAALYCATPRHQHRSEHSDYLHGRKRGNSNHYYSDVSAQLGISSYYIHTSSREPPSDIIVTFPLLDLAGLLSCSDSRVPLLILSSEQEP